MRLLRGGRAAAVGVLLLAGLAGCSTLSGSPAATTTAQPDAIAIWREVIQCVRDNGAPNLPDPQFDSNGQPQFPGGDPDVPPRAIQACEHIYNRLPAQARGDEEQPPPDMPTLVRFAGCMRQHGLTDFPDPKPDGIFWLANTNARTELYGPGREKGPQSPRALAALEACGFNGELRGKIFFDVGN